MPPAWKLLNLHLYRDKADVPGADMRSGATLRTAIVTLAAVLFQTTPDAKLATLRIYTCGTSTPSSGLVLELPTV
jgi:hypothetical protein